MTDPLTAAANAATLADRVTAFFRFLRTRLWQNGRPQLPHGSSAAVLRRRQRHPFELRPIRFEIFLDVDLPTVEVWFYAINYRPRTLTLWSAIVPGFYLSGGPKLENIPFTGDIALEPGNAFIFRCRRALADSEVRVIAAMQQASMAHASYEVIAHARDRRAELTYRASAMAIDGWIHCKERQSSTGRDHQPNDALERTGMAEELDTPAAQRGRWTAEH